MPDEPAATTSENPHNGAPGNGSGNGGVPSRGSGLGDSVIDGEATPRLDFPVVAVGASAGGLKAYQDLLKALPEHPGMAFVLIQHLPPDRESLLVELLLKQTSLPVLQVEDGLEVKPDHVYVTRPGHTLLIEDGRLRIGESVRKPGHREPIDMFFASLAREQHSRAVAVVLSGMGSNGTAGAQEVKAAGGLCIAQDPETAQYPSMPRSLINRHLADVVLRPDEIPELLQRYVQHDYVQNDGPPDLQDVRARQALDEVLSIVNTRTRHDFNGYKTPTLLRRIQRRMGLSQIQRLEDYSKVLRQTPTEVAALADDLLINVTGFFRDPEVWEALREEVIEPLVAERPDMSSIRAWVTACSSGEEAYSLGMLLMEAAGARGKSFDIKVFATDMAERSLAHARRGSFAAGIESDLSPERLDRFFIHTDDHFLIKKELRELIVFAPQNVLSDPPFSRLDVCTCRNLLIYLEPDVQRRLLRLLHFGLREGGALLLGNSETVGVEDDLFQPIDKKHKLYRRVGPTRHGLVDFASVLTRERPTSAASDNFTSAPRVSLAQVAHKALLESHTPAAVVVDQQGQVAYFHGDTARYFAPPQGEPTRDVLLLVREVIRGAVRSALREVVKENGPVTIRDGLFDVEGERRRAIIDAAPLKHHGHNGYYLVTFRDIAEPVEVRPSADDDGKNAGEFGGHEHRLMSDELQRVEAELQSTIEELQTSNEEMKASHEEVTSVNEELQSTNEELETSKEELQSLNEELTTVNAQLGSKASELEEANSDLASLLASTDIAVLFLDTSFRIRRFTPSVSDLFDLIPSDVDRPLRDLARKFDDPDLLPDAQRVLDRLVPREREVASQSGHTYLRRVLPYRDAGNRIDGVVLTFVDITERKKAAEALRVSEQRYRDLVGTASIGIAEIGADGRLFYVNDRYCRIVGRPADQLIEERTDFELTHRDDADAYRKCVQDMLNSGEACQVTTRYTRPDGATVWVEKFVSVTDGKGGDGDRMRGVLAVVDVTERERAEHELRENERKLRLAAEAADMGFWEYDPKEREVVCDKRYNRMMGLAPDVSCGSYEDVMRRVHPEDRSEVDRLLSGAVRDAEAYTSEFRVVLDGGETTWVAARARPVTDDAGRTVRMVGSTLDITRRHAEEQERLRLLEEAEAARDRAEAANEAKDRFLANISHELRTPLAAITLWAKALRQGWKVGQPLSEAEREEGIEAIQNSAQAQRHLIEDLLDTTRITSGKMRLELEAVDPAEVIRRAVENVQATARAREIGIAVELPTEPLEVTADAARLRQVLWNLLSNSIKFTPVGGGVTVSLGHDERDVIIAVRDTGRGISGEFLPRVFERFGQADGGGDGGGLGLGLSIVRNLMEMHGGTVTADSDGDGHGSTFTLRLPRSRGV